MVERILDLHIHSKYSRACSKNLELPAIGATCETRGVDIVATGDFTHPMWFQHMKDTLVEETPGIYAVKDSKIKTRFIIATEVASIKKHAGKTRRVHLLILSPSLEITEKFNQKLESRGFNLRSDGRPILGVTCKEILEMMLDVDERMMLIPAHAWTPWFGIFGSYGGYNSMEECFEDLTPYVSAIETGLSSDPKMNWRITKLDNITLVSNSDAHSLAKIGREANILSFNDAKEITYSEIVRILRTGDKKKFLRTIEFYPEEGKYHLDGHADCNFVCTPRETRRLGGVCPKCKKHLVIGVMYRVEELADRPEDVVWDSTRVPYTSSVPLPEIISDVLGVGVVSKAVCSEYERLIKALGSEFHILLRAKIEEIEKISGKIMAEAISRVREGNVYVKPGFDGVFGVVKVFEDGISLGKKKQSTLLLD